MTLNQVREYLVGHFRNTLYYHDKFKYLIRTHIREQIAFRIEVMNQKCYDKGICVACSCDTTAKQCIKNSCDNLCYPPFMSKKVWDYFKANDILYNKLKTFLYDANNRIN